MKDSSIEFLSVLDRSSKKIFQIFNPVILVYLSIWQILCLSNRYYSSFIFFEKPMTFYFSAGPTDILRNATRSGQMNNPG